MTPVLIIWIYPAIKLVNQRSKVYWEWKAISFIPQKYDSYYINNKERHKKIDKIWVVI